MTRTKFPFKGSYPLHEHVLIWRGDGLVPIVRKSWLTYACNTARVKQPQTGKTAQNCSEQTQFSSHCEEKNALFSGARLFSRDKQPICYVPSSVLRNTFMEQGGKYFFVGFSALRSPNTSLTLFWLLKYINRFKYIIVTKDTAGRTKRDHYLLNWRRRETKRLFLYSYEEFQFQYWTSFGSYLQYSFTWQLMMIKLRHVNSSIKKRVEFKAYFYQFCCTKENGSVVERTCTSKYFNSSKSTNRYYLEELWRQISNGFRDINTNGTSIVQWGCVFILNLLEKENMYLDPM